MVDDGETGLLFEPFSAADLRAKIEQLFARKDECVRMGKAAREKAEREYSLESHLRRLLVVYEDLLGASAKHRRALAMPAGPTIH